MISIGGGLSLGTLAAEKFVLGTSASDSDDRFIYNQTNGKLFFDIDGNGGTAKLLVATFSNKPPDFDATNIVLI